MHLLRYLFVAGLLAGMVLAGGCISGTQNAPSSTTPMTTLQTPSPTLPQAPVTAAGQVNYTTLLSGYMLQQADLPAGFIIYREGELRIPEGISNPLGFRGGYDLNANRLLTNDTTEEVKQTILVFTSTPENLSQIFTTLYPELAANTTLSTFPVPGFDSNSSIGYVWEKPKGSIPDAPDISVSGALVIMRDDAVLEIVHVIDSNSTANRTLVFDLAQKAAAKLPAKGIL